MFAIAEGDTLGFVDLEFHWLEAGTFVGTITKGLVFRLAAAAPPVCAGGEFEFGGCLAAMVGVGMEAL